MNIPIVTVYITNYNYGKYIKQAIESVLSQTYSNIELLIVDDGSTDNSKELIEQYAGHQGIEIIYQQNKGLNITNNIALRLANGKYIMRLDADDYLESIAVETMVKILENNDQLGLVFPDYYLVDADGEMLEQVIRHDFEHEVSLFDQPAHGACTMIRTQFLRDIGGYNENYKCQDGYELWIKFILNHPVKNINKPLFYYRQHGSNLTSNKQRILNTRAAIHQEHISKTYTDLPTCAIIPVRGQKGSKQPVEMMELGDKLVLEHKIDEILKTKYIKKIVVTSPDQNIGDWLHKKYTDVPKVTFHLRALKEARLNTNLNSTIKQVLTSLGEEKEQFLAIALLYIEFPFIQAMTIDDAINALYLFGADSLVSVQQENSMLFQHHGNGMKAILNQDKFTKLERENLYRLVGGINIVKMEAFDSFGKTLCGKIGHTEITKEESLGLHSQFDIDIARLFIEKNIQAVKS